jgi:hypothetical protein
LISWSPYLESICCARRDGQVSISQFQKASEDDLKAIEAIGEVLVGSNRPFLVTSPTAVAMSVEGKPVTEDSPLAPWNPRAASERATKALKERGVKTSVVRLSQVHDTHKQGAVTYALQVAREKGESAYVGDGSNRWSAGTCLRRDASLSTGLREGRAGCGLSRCRRRRRVSEGNGRGDRPWA